MRHDRPTLREILKGSVRWNSEKSTKKGRQEGKAVTETEHPEVLKTHACKSGVLSSVSPGPV